MRTIREGSCANDESLKLSKILNAYHAKFHWLQDLRVDVRKYNVPRSSVLLRASFLSFLVACQVFQYPALLSLSESTFAL